MGPPSAARMCIQSPSTGVSEDLSPAETDRLYGEQRATDPAVEIRHRYPLVGQRKMSRARAPDAMAAASTAMVATGTSEAGNASSEMKIETVKGIPAAAAAPTTWWALTFAGSRALNRPTARNVASEMPAVFPISLATTMPTATGLLTAAASALADSRTPAFARANSGSTRKLVQRWRTVFSRVSGDTASLDSSAR